jgi:cell division septation protein DedD
VRTLLAFALVLIACGPSDRRDPAAAQRVSATSLSGPEPLVLRIPRTGGPAMVAAYPHLDSVVWRSTGRLPAPGRVLGFDGEEGTLALADTLGRPVRLDLRGGKVTREARPKLTGLASADGAYIYGLTAKGDVMRLAPSGERWTYKPPRPARELLPQADGWLVVVADASSGSVAWRLRPPEQRIVDSLELPRVRDAIAAGVADRIYFTVPAGLAGARARGLEPVPTVPVAGEIQDVASTPSGDRLFVVTAGATELLVVDRYAEGIGGRIQLPGLPRELRMDPLGRTLLVRAAMGDSAWVVTLGTDAVVGAVRTVWRPDLPFIASDGSVLLGQGKDVVVADPQSLAPRARVEGGASDFWYAFAWDGFRPAAEEPEELPPPLVATDTIALDSLTDTLAPAPDSARGLPIPSPTPAPRVDTAARAPAPPPPVPPRPTGFNVSFATLLSEDRARELASSIRVNGQQARVSAGQRSGVPIFRVLLGPFATREAAERAGQASGQSYWIIEGAP